MLFQLSNRTHSLTPTPAICRTDLPPADGLARKLVLLASIFVGLLFVPCAPTLLVASFSAPAPALASASLCLRFGLSTSILALALSLRFRSRSLALAMEHSAHLYVWPYDSHQDLRYDPPMGKRCNRTLKTHSLKRFAAASSQVEATLGKTIRKSIFLTRNCIYTEVMFS